ncbi:MAG: cytidine/deoxycytidylate deaminase family protein [Candidatus Komeilibacteria bacterium]
MTEDKHNRPNWDEYFFKIMEVVGLRGTCDRGRSGCVIVRNNHILCTGYVGSPPGLAHCDEAGHIMIKSTNENDPQEELHAHCVRTIHAEQNALAHAARIGVALKGSTIYVKMEPCPVCTRLLIAAGIKEVICQFKYHSGNVAREMLSEAGVEFKVVNDEHNKYEGVEDPSKG